jgi:hypothetical protein
MGEGLGRGLDFPRYFLFGGSSVAILAQVESLPWDLIEIDLRRLGAKQPLRPHRSFSAVCAHAGVWQGQQ